MNSETGEILTSLLGCSQSKWMMWPSERLALIGLLEIIKPQSILELGCAEGGFTQWLSRYGQSVTTVDISPEIKIVTQDMTNVTALMMTTMEAFDWIRARGLKFDLTIIDADHSRTGVKRDLENAIRLSRIVVLHDTYYPPCREGILDVVAGRDYYYDLELVPGGLQPDGMWGGLGIVLPQFAKKEKQFVTPRLSTYPLLLPRWKRLQRWGSFQQKPHTISARTKFLLRKLLARANTPT